MANLLVVGAQWGDEGKGKVIDLITPAFDIIARYQGGHNAGHTVIVNGEKIILHLIPSGILHPGKLCVIGNGVVVHPKALLGEISELTEYGIQIGDNVAVSKDAHLIMPYHSLLEKASEERRGAKKIGTTLRGIGPCYEDKAARRGIRVGDLLMPSLLREKIQDNIEEKNIYFESQGIPRLDPEKVFTEYSRYALPMEKYIKDVSLLLDKRMKKGQSLLFEGAQGTLLDIDHGTYPYVTSSSSTAGGVCTGLGVAPDKIHSVLGVTKAYTTRVGEGPFPTEIFDDTGKFLLQKGNEFGATTGRPRRCGWFDAVAVSYACRINGIQKVALTKPDVLDGLPEIKICVGYRYKQDLLRNFPTESWMLKDVIPEFKKVKGWQRPLNEVAAFSGLPAEFKNYVKTIEDLIEARVVLVSTGMERKNTIFRRDELTSWLDLERVEAEL